MLQSSAVKPSAAPPHPSGTVVTDPTLRLMAAAAARSAGRPDLTPRPSIAAAVAANELYASLLYSQQHQLDRAAMLMHQHHSHFSPLPSASSQRTPQHQTQPRQAHSGGFALPQYQSSSQSHPHHLIQAPGPAAAAAFESYSQSLATLSQLSQRLQVHSSPHSRMPAPPTVDPYLPAAAAAASVHGGRAGSPASTKRQSPSQAAVSDAPRHRNPYEFCESPDDKHRVRYEQDEVRCHRRHHHRHQQRVQPDDVCHDENHNAFQRRDKRQEVTVTHAPTALPLTAAHDEHRSVSGDTTGKSVDTRTVTGNGNDVISESPSGSELLLRSAATSCHGRYKCERERVGADFTHGSRIQLSDGRIKRIEDMRTEDFVLSSSSVGVAGGRDVTSSQLVLVSSRVVHIRLNHDTYSAILGFVVDNNIQLPVSVETGLEQPFFVHGAGWSSCDPARTHARYQLACRQLSIGDTCISLTTDDRGHRRPILDNSRGSSEWTISAGQQNAAVCQDDRHDRQARLRVPAASRKRRWSAPAEATPTVTARYHGNTSSSSNNNNNKTYYAGNFSSKSK